MKRDDRTDNSWRRGGVDPNLLYAKSRLIGFIADEAKSILVMGYHTKNDLPESKIYVYLVADNKKITLSLLDNGAERYPRVASSMVESIERFQLIGAKTAPTKPGFVVEGGIFADQGKPFVLEEFTLTLKFPEHPDARFFLSSRAIREEDKDEPSLSTRAGREINMLRENAPGLKVLAKESRRAADQKGYWVGISAPYDSEVPGGRLRKFFWSADGVPNDVTRPFLEMELMIEPTKETGSTFKDDKEAEEFWDRMLDSLQIRPGAVEPRFESAAPR
jgi:hypothetical protein